MILFIKPVIEPTTMAACVKYDFKQHIYIYLFKSSTTVEFVWPFHTDFAKNVTYLLIFSINYDVLACLCNCDLLVKMFINLIYNNKIYIYEL